VAHPHDLLGGEVVEQHGRGVVDAEPRPAELGHAGAGDLASESHRHRLLAVADAEDGDAEIEQARVDPRRAGLVDGLGASRQHDARGAAFGEGLGGRIVRDDLG
jgi:hypothetical protein